MSTAAKTMRAAAKPKGGFKSPPLGKAHRRVIELAIADIEKNGWSAETRSLTVIILKYTRDASQLLDRIRRAYSDTMSLQAWERTNTQADVLALLREVLHG